MNKTERIINERAKNGVPSLALTEQKERLYGREGFDEQGYFWYRHDSPRLEPEIHAGAYLLLEKVPHVDDVCGINGATYVLCLKMEGGYTEIITGRVLNSAHHSKYIRVMTRPAIHAINDIPKKYVVEAYKVAWVMEKMPS